MSATQFISVFFLISGVSFLVFVGLLVLVFRALSARSKGATGASH